MMKQLALASALLFAFALAGCGGKAERLSSHLQRSKEYLQQLEYEKASVEIRNVLQIDPKHAEAYFVAGQIEEGRQAYQRAFVNYTRALELDHGRLDAKIRLARLYLAGGQPSKAAELVAEVLAARPDDPGARAVKAALLLASKGDTKAAIEEAEAVLAVDSAQVDAASVLAGLYLSRKDESKALEVLDRTLAVNPRSIELHGVRAAVAAQMKENAKVEESYRAIVALEPKKLDHRMRLASFLSQSGQVDAAERVLREAIAADPDDERRYVALSDFLAATKGLQAAERELLALIEAHPKVSVLRSNLATVYLRMGESAKAQAVLTEIVRREGSKPPGLAARVRLARLHAGERRIPDAERLIAEVLKENPRDNGALLLRAQLALDRKDPASAIIDLRAVARDQPGSVEVIGLLARAHQLAGQSELGKDAIASAINLYPRSLPLRFLMVEYLLASDDRAGALKELDDAIRAQPTAVVAYERKAELLARANEWAGAENTFAELKKAVPDSPTGYLGAGQVQIAQKHYPKAIREFEDGIARFPASADLRYALVNAYLTEGKFDIAATKAKDYLAAQPDNFLPYLMLGEVNVGQKRFAEAESAFRKSIELNPKSSLAYLNLFRVRLLQGSREEAIAALQEGSKALPTDPTLFATLANLYRELGRIDDTIAEYERVLALDPHNEVAVNNLAVVLSELKSDQANLDRALKLAQRFEQSNNPAYVDTLGWVYAKLGRYNDAVPLLQRAVDQAPREPVLQFHLGMTLYKSGNRDGAITHLKQALDAKADFPGAADARKIVYAQ